MVGGVAVGSLLVGVGLFAWAWTRRGAEEVTVDQSVEGFRHDGQTSGTAGLLRPAAGVYRYAATGQERLSVLGTSQDWGDPVPATVTHGDDGCWTIRFDFSTNHSQTTTYCPAGRVLREVSGSTSQTFDFVAPAISDVTNFRCDPPGQLIRLDAAVGRSWRQSCDGTSADRGTTVTSAGTNTYLGTQRVDVGGTSVRALHYRVERTLSGDQRGTERNEVWYHPLTGLPLRRIRTVEVASPSPIGDITYTEGGTVTLDSLTPRV